MENRFSLENPPGPEPDDFYPWGPKEPKQKEEPLKKKPEEEPKKEQPSKPAKETLKENKPEKEVEQKKSSQEVKQEKRQEAVERSQALKRHFEETPIPRDPHLVARLMVAEHIIALNEEIEEPHTGESKNERVQLEAALDYMGELAEKLENPSVESSSDIEEAYEAVIQLAHQALEEQPPEEIIKLTVEELQVDHFHEDKEEDSIPVDIIHFPVNTETSPSQPTPSVVKTLVAAIKQFRKNGAKQGFIIQAPTPPIVPLPFSPRPIARAKNNDHLLFPPSSESGPRSITAPTSIEAQSVHKKIETSERRAHSFAAPIAAIALATALGKNAPKEKPSVYTMPKSEIATSSPARMPAAERHSILAETPRPPLQHRTETVSLQRQNTPPIAETSPYKQHTPDHHEHQPELHNTPPFTEQALPRRKLEHMPLYTLLHMAEGVSLGHGRYLREVFEHNEIDKEGLVKVLKARSKGKDFVMEFSHQKARFRTIKSSPEFLKSVPAPAFTPTFMPREEPSVTSEKQPQQETTQPSIPQKNLLKPQMTEKTTPLTPLSSVNKQPHPDMMTAAWIAAILIALAILTALLLYLF